MQDPDTAVTALRMFFENKDIEFAMIGKYRLTSANQAIHDEVYVNPAHRLAELDAKPISSMRYRTCNPETPINAMLVAIDAAIARDIDEASQKLKPLGLKPRMECPWVDEGSYERIFVYIDTLPGFSFGASFAAIQFNEHGGYFQYPSCLYTDDTTPLPQGMYDLQRVVDIFYAVCPSQTIELITKGMV